MKPTENIERLMQSVRLSTSTALDDRILTDSTEALVRARRTPPAPGRIFRIGRLLMQNRYAKFATAAVVVAAVSLGIASFTILSSGVAYAFDQTVQARHSVRSLHIQSAGQIFGGNPGEFWVEFDETGQLVRCRMEWPQTEDGHKIVFYRDNKVDVWFKTKNGFATYGLGHQVATQMHGMAMACDPKMTVVRLQQEQAAGRVRIETQAPAAGDELIVLTVTYQPTSGKQGRRVVLGVDPATKLVRWIDKLELVKDRYESLGRIDILEYNQPIDPAVFTPQLPEDIMRIDQTTQQVGLAQGEMTEAQVAKEVVRQFFQAMIDKDYAKAGQLFSGMPASKMQEMVERMKMPVVRIVSIGEPIPHAVTRGLKVPVTVEVEDNGQLREWSPNGPFVRQVESDPTRWQIIGGV
jgi:hypothetical protein